MNYKHNIIDTITKKIYNKVSYKSYCTHQFFGFFAFQS